MLIAPSQEQGPRRQNYPVRNAPLAALQGAGAGASRGVVEINVGVLRSCRSQNRTGGVGANLKANLQDFTPRSRLEARWNGRQSKQRPDQ
jgi:hypothetical protein